MKEKYHKLLRGNKFNHGSYDIANRMHLFKKFKGLNNLMNNMTSSINNTISVNKNKRSPLIKKNVLSPSERIQNTLSNLIKTPIKNRPEKNRESATIEVTNLGNRFKFIGKGKVSIIGISYIRGDVHEINNIFDYKIKTFLYSQLHDEDKEYNFEKKKRKKKFSEYNFLNNKDKRKNYTFDILDYDSNINISIANNESVLTIYQYEVYFFPIKILNNSKYEIRKFSIFFEAEEKEKILLPPYFYNDYQAREGYDNPKDPSQRTH
jgi:hypothetical protein